MGVLLLLAITSLVPLEVNHAYDSCPMLNPDLMDSNFTCLNLFV